MKSEGATALYDAVYLAGEALEDREGRRVVIVVSDGGDTISKVKFQDALESLHAANAVLYSVLVVPVQGDAGRNLRGENALTTLSTWTGGKIFFPVAGPALDDAFRPVLREVGLEIHLLGMGAEGGDIGLVDLQPGAAELLDEGGLAFEMGGLAGVDRRRCPAVRGRRAGDGAGQGQGRGRHAFGRHGRGRG